MSCRDEGSIFRHRQSSNAGGKFKLWDNLRVSRHCEEAMVFQIEEDAWCTLSGKMEKAVPDTI